MTRLKTLGSVRDGRAIPRRRRRDRKGRNKLLGGNFSVGRLGDPDHRAWRLSPRWGTRQAVLTFRSWPGLARPSTSVIVRWIGSWMPGPRLGTNDLGKLHDRLSQRQY